MQYLPENLKKITLTPKAVKLLPETPGVYIFSKKNVPIYVGKAINLKRRVSSYFDLHLEIKTGKMISQADSISVVKVGSEIEALLLEARLIRKYMPQYNIQSKDDKHPLYIVITKEKFPRVISVRKLDVSNLKLMASFGPFPNSTNVKSVLKMIRRVFPYSDHKLGKRPCLYSHIGLCNPCPSAIEQLTVSNDKQTLRKIYLKNIRRIKAILSGKFMGVRDELEKEMNNFSKKEKYEEAAIIRNKIQSLDYITSPQMPTDFYMQNPNLVEEIREKESEELLNILKPQYPNLKSIKRIECYDIAHMAGSSPTASMVTFINGEADKTLYRHFKVKKAKGGDDYGSLKEVIQRRLKHLDSWGRPDLIIIDGGKGQVSIFVRELKSTQIPVIGLAKRFETIVIPENKEETLTFKEIRIKNKNVLNLVQRIRDEAHRFARVYHHKLFSKNLISGGS